MAWLQYLLREGEVLRYLVEVTVLDPAQNQAAELRFELPLAVGPAGRIEGTPRLTSTEGSLVEVVRAAFLEPVHWRISSSGLDLDDPGRPAPPYLPRLLEEPVEAGEGWSVLERAPNGEDVEASYRLESVSGGRATLATKNAAGESAIEFSLVEGRVLDARAVLSSGPLQVSLWYRLSEPGT